MARFPLFPLGRAGLSGLLLATALGHAQAGNYSGTYFFGDSLSDSGTFASLVGANAKFTTNPGTVWTDNLGANYGQLVRSAYTANPLPGYALNSTGNNFAIGGARVSGQPGVLNGALSAWALSLPPVSSQVSAFLARGALDSGALYGLWAGANDVFTQAGAIGVGLPVPAAIGNMATAGSEMVNQVTRLQAAGARNMIVIGVPDIGATPYGAAQGVAGAALLSTLTSTYNTTLSSGLAGKNLLYFDGAKLFSAILASPARYGFSNTTLPACGAASALGCVPGAAATGALFADGVHPSSAAHRVISDWVYSSLEGAGQMGVLSRIPLARSGVRWRAMDGRVQEFQNFGYRGQGVFVTADYAPGKLDAALGQPSADGASSSLLVGYERAISDTLFAGATLGYGKTPVDLGNNQGKVDYDEWALSGFVSHKIGSFYANALLSYAWLDFDSKRNVALGVFSTTEKGSSHGSQYGGKLQVGYNFTAGNVVHGPLAAVSWERVGVDAFSEQSAAPTAMRYGKQVRESLRSRIGWQLAASDVWSGMTVHPYSQLTYDYEHKKDERTYGAGFVGGASELSMPLANRTGGYGRFLAGINAEVSRAVFLGVEASTTFSQPGANSSALSATLSTRF